MSMQGFQEEGAPDGWDMAVGTVRGYRWWVALIEFSRNYGGLMYSRAGSYTRAWGELTPQPDFRDTKPWWPDMARVTVQGMHGGSWTHINSRVNGGWHTASCPQTSHGCYGAFFPDSPARVPEPSCGCGYWAYWNGLPEEWDACRPFIRYESDTRFTVRVPLAGVIEGSGRTIIGERGFRCGKARITDFALNLDANCLVEEPYTAYNPARPLDLWFSPNSGRVPYTAYEGPVTGGNFLRYMESIAGYDKDDLAALCRAAVESQVGSNFTWHKTPRALTEKCLPDVNYGKQ